MLKSIFISLLNNPDGAVAESALTCVLSYKDDYLIPYADVIRSLFVKGNLRQALLHFRSMFDSGTVAREHSVKMVPIVMRICFGRLSARAHVKSSKDSPAARKSKKMRFTSLNSV